MKSIAIPAVFLFMAAAIPVAAFGQGLCENSESILFNCLMGKKIAAICAAPINGNGFTFAQYRYGTPKKIEMKFPSQISSDKGSIYISHTAYSAGGETHISFNNNGYSYILYNYSIRTGFDHSSNNNEKFGSGLLLKYGEKEIFKRKCNNPDSGIDRRAFNILPKALFVQMQR